MSESLKLLIERLASVTNQAQYERLREVLLPLLEAGQAMHDEAQGDYQTFGAAYKAWDAALNSAAQENP